MLPLKNRLKKGKDFQKVFKEGKLSLQEDIILKYTKNGLMVSRIGFAIGKKITQKTVQKNRIKRILREAFHQHLENINAGFDIIVIYSPKNHTKEKINLDYLSVQIKKILEKNNLLKIKKQTSAIHV